MIRRPDFKLTFLLLALILSNTASDGTFEGFLIDVASQCEGCNSRTTGGTVITLDPSVLKLSDDETRAVRCSFYGVKDGQRFPLAVSWSASQGAEDVVKTASIKPGLGEEATLWVTAVTTGSSFGESSFPIHRFPRISQKSTKIVVEGRPPEAEFPLANGQLTVTLLSRRITARGVFSSKFNTQQALPVVYTSFGVQIHDRLGNAEPGSWTFVVKPRDARFNGVFSADAVISDSSWGRIEYRLEVYELANSCPGTCEQTVILDVVAHRTDDPNVVVRANLPFFLKFVKD